MGVIIISRNAKHDTHFQNSLPINRNLFFDLHGRPAFPKSQEETADRSLPLRIPNQAGETTVVPNPTPDTGLRPTHERGAGYPLASTPGSMPTTHLGSSMEHLPIASTQPALQLSSQISPWIPAPTTIPSTVIIDTSSTTNTTTPQPLPTAEIPVGPRGRSRPALPLAATVLIAIGGSFLLVAIFVASRWLNPPRRRRIPKPSLPKLENAMADEEKMSTIQESPIFGPNERFSQRSGTNPTWSWVTYPQSRTMGNVNKAKREDTLGSGNPPPLRVAYLQSPSLHLLSGQTELPKDTHRITMMPLAYKGTPTVALKETETSYSADRHEAVKRRSRTLRKSRGNSFYEERHRGSRTSIGQAYDGADVTSPIQPIGFTPLGSLDPRGDANATKVENRSRIQSPYYPTGSYPRMLSGVPTTYGVATRVKLGDGTLARGGGSPNLKSGLQRARELTQALGLSSPTTDDLILSPQPTLYPDDSLSIVESKRLLKQRSQKKRLSTSLGDDSQTNQVSDERRDHLVATTTRSVVAIASGSLMSAEDLRALSTGNNVPGTKLVTSLTGPTLVNKSSGTKSSLATTRNELRNSDRPPRVPSPPRLPSLAQMALEHSNPDAYASYRSPTYSIYNLYDDDWKSTVCGAKLNRQKG